MGAPSVARPARSIRAVTDRPADARTPTSTSAFGVSRRESHDSSDFYARFHPPTLSADDTVNPPGPVDWIHCGDARQMTERVRPNSVALVVTSPPYFAGKAYETELGQGHIPGSYLEYLQMLRDVFAACVEVLEPGGRIAVNVANLGRKPYRSLSADVISILQDDLGLLLRGEIIWRKAEGSSGNCAWGSFRSASNPVLRDLTERVIVASKGRFDRALNAKVRAKRGLPHENSVLTDDFMDWTTDVWDLGTESAVRVGHPAPYPAELPQRLIELYTYEGDVVLDPFMGSGSTAVAAVRTRRHYVGVDTDQVYVKAARARADEAVAELSSEGAAGDWHVVPAPADPDDRHADLVEQAVRERWKLRDLAFAVLEQSGFTIVGGGDKPARVGSGVEVTCTVADATGTTWLVDVVGSLTRGTSRTGLRSTELVQRTIGRAAIAAGALERAHPYLVLTMELPPRGTAQASALKAARGAKRPLYDVLALSDRDARTRLARYATRGPGRGPLGELYPTR